MRRLWGENKHLVAMKNILQYLDDDSVMPAECQTRSFKTVSQTMNGFQAGK